MVSSRVLLTGATGFIGSLLCRRLIEQNYNVGIFKRSVSSTWRIEELMDKLNVYNVDLKDTQAVHDATLDFKPDAIFNLATYYTVEHKLFEIPTMIETNVLGAINLLEAFKDSSAKLFVNTSSCFVYKEKSAPLSETDELSPLNLYAATKLQAEQACFLYSENYGLKTVTFRLFPPYGPADNERKLIPFMIRHFLEGNRPNLTTGMQRWDFTYVNDIVDAFICALNTEFKQKHEILNIGTGNATSIREVASIIAKILSSDLQPNWDRVSHRKNEVWFTSANISKAKEILNWQPKVLLQDGLNATVNWYRNCWKMGK